MPHVVLLRPLHPDAMARFEAEPGITVTLVPDADPARIRQVMPAAEAVVVRATRIDRDFLANAPQLRICARHGVGYDAVDVAALTERGIPLTVTPDANAISVAEHALMLMLTLSRQTVGYDARTRALRWGLTDELPCFDLFERTVLVVGFGRIGGRVARLCHAFGMRVLVHDPYVPGNTIKGAGFTPVKLMEGLAQADIVTTHCPSNAETRGMVNRQFLAAMKPGACYVNTARGTLVDEAALAAALRSGHVAGAGLDVFHEEPMVAGNPVREAPNVVMSPHSAAGTAQGMRRMGLSCAESIISFFKGQLDPDVVINKEVLRGNA